MSQSQDYEPKCIPELLISYGLSYRDEPVNQTLKFCPNVFKSCCSIEDQKQIYQQWIVQEEEKLLKEKFDWMKSIYLELFLKLENIQKKGDALNQKLQKKSISNCKILSRRLTQMQIDYIRPKLEKQFETMFEFYETSFKGIYCMICDANSQAYIDHQKQAIIFSDDYCRDVVTNLLTPMIYLHDLIFYYLNLINKFLVSCDPAGKFENKAPKPQFLFHSEFKTKGILQNCNKQVNKVDWLDQCSGLCDKIHITTFNREFLAPHLKKFIALNTYLDEQILLWEKKEEILKNSPAEFENSVENPSTKQQDVQKRLLEEENAKNEDDQKDKKEKEEEEEKKPLITPEDIIKQNKYLKLTDKDIFAGSGNSMINLDLMIRTYKQGGINPYQIGKKAAMTEENYRAISGAVNNRKLKQIEKLRRERELFNSGIELIKMILGILFIFF